MFQRRRQLAKEINQLRAERDTMKECLEAQFKLGLTFAYYLGDRYIEYTAKRAVWEMNEKIDDLIIQRDNLADGIDIYKHQSKKSFQDGERERIVN